MEQPSPTVTPVSPAERMVQVKKGFCSLYTENGLLLRDVQTNYSHNNQSILFLH